MNQEKEQKVKEYYYKHVPKGDWHYLGPQAQRQWEGYYNNDTCGENPVHEFQEDIHGNVVPNPLYKEVGLHTGIMMGGTEEQRKNFMKRQLTEDEKDKAFYEKNQYPFRDCNEDIIPWNELIASDKFKIWKLRLEEEEELADIAEANGIAKEIITNPECGAAHLSLPALEEAIQKLASLPEDGHPSNFAPNPNEISVAMGNFAGPSVPSLPEDRPENGGYFTKTEQPIVIKIKRATININKP